MFLRRVRVGGVGFVWETQLPGAVGLASARLPDASGSGPVLEPNIGYRNVWAADEVVPIA